MGLSVRISGMGDVSGTKGAARAAKADLFEVARHAPVR